jgi:hypothetical protein
MRSSLQALWLLIADDAAPEGGECACTHAGQSLKCVQATYSHCDVRVRRVDRAARRCSSMHRSKR